jgi:hypothetical protein
MELDGSDMSSELSTNEGGKRARLSIDLEAYPDVKRMLSRVQDDRKGVSRSKIVMEFLRQELIRQGYARNRKPASQARTIKCCDP